MTVSTKYLGHALTLPEPVSFAPPRWTYRQRIAFSRARNPHHTTGRGTARRDRLEIRVLTNGMAALEALWHPGATIETGDGQIVRVQTLLYNRIPLTPWALDLRFKVRGMLHWLSENGPGARGWALKNPLGAAERGPKSTGYYLPRRSEAACRQWRGVLRQMLQLVRFLARMWPRLSPALRPAVKSDGIGVVSASSGFGNARGAMSRAQIDGWQAVAERIERRLSGQEPA